MVHCKQSIDHWNHRHRKQTMENSSKDWHMRFMAPSAHEIDVAWQTS